MKRLMSFVLMILLVIGLCACGGETVSEEPETTAGLQVGFGRANITPKEPVWISGGGNPNRISTSFIDYLYVTCVAITDPSGNTYLIFTQDLQGTRESYTGPAKKTISQETGVPVENMMISSTHTHSAPGLTNASRTGIPAAIKIYSEGMLRAAQDAMADRSPATVSVGCTQAEDYVFVRHYILDNGTYAGANYGDFNKSTIRDHAYKANTTLQMIRFTRLAEGKKDILMMNLGAHATFNGSTSLTDLSADFPGPLRDHIEANSDLLVAYFISAAGDQAPDSRIASEVVAKDYREYGKGVGQLVLDALPTLTEVKSGDFKFTTESFTMTTNKTGMDRLQEATETYNAYLEGGYPLSDPLVAKYGFVRVFEARAIVQRSTLADTYTFDVWAMSMGDVSFVFAPYEMFGKNAAQITEESPFSMTFIATCANDGHGYIPAEDAYEFNCYEAYSSKAAPGHGEKLAQLYVEMLNDLKGA